jgi:predicted Zn-dependent protease
MKKIILLLIATGLVFAESLDDNILMQALTDEMTRSMSSLRIEKQEKPCYLSYRVTDGWACDIQAEFGGIVSSTRNHRRDIYVDLRVGSPALDNSNFACQSSGPSAIESDRTNLPLEDDYYALRKFIWLVTDGTYKKALERLSRKKAVIQNRPTKDSLPDFSAVPLCAKVEPEARLNVNQAEWETSCAAISKLFQKFPRIFESNVTMHIAATNQYFLDGQGNKSRRADHQAYIEVLAKTQSDDGDPIEDFIGFYSTSAEGLPKLEEISRFVSAMAETLSLLVALKKEESYSGPVLFTSQAAAELFFQMLGKGVSDPRPPLYENDMVARNANSDNFGNLTGRIGRRVMPDFLSAYDDPNLAKWEGTDLFGRFAIDDQGVKSERVDIAKDGKLTGFLMSRSPVKKIASSNGHARYRDENLGGRVIGLPGVLVVESRETKNLEGLKKTLTRTAQDFDNKYAIIVTRLAAARPRSTFEQYMRWFTPAPSAGDKPMLSAPTVAYKVDLATGKTELIRGLDFSSITTRLLRDISAVSKETYTYNFLYHDNEGNAYPMSVVAPAVLIDEVEMVTRDTKPTKPPILGHPFFKKR